MVSDKDRSRLAPAKINLTLHVTGQQPNGYHVLDSLVVFTEFGDEVSISAGDGLTLDVSGEQAPALAPENDNLVLRAARLMGEQGGALRLVKNLPVASGMGGGSSDAAATLHLLSDLRGAPLPSTDQAMALGADVPVCLAAPSPCRMRGLGERVEPVLGVPALWMLLVNPGQALATPAVFQALASRQNAPMPQHLPQWSDAVGFCDWLNTQRNDLEPPALSLVPQVAEVLTALTQQPGCLLARMTGSGATCFAVFASEAALSHAAQAMRRPDWFVAATRTVGSVS